MSREEKLHEIVHFEASIIASGALNSGEGEEFLVQLCGWTQEEIDKALEGCEDEL